MARKQELHEVEDLGERIDWILAYLDTDPLYSRFCGTATDIYVALVNAVDEGKFQVRLGELKSKQSWDRNLRENRLSKLTARWLLTLFPDLVHEQLFAETLLDFKELGLPVQVARDRWAKSIDFLAKNRKAVATFAERFYQEVNYSNSEKFPFNDFPLLTKPGWIRKQPLPLTLDTETEWLKLPSQGAHYSPIKLDGLSGDYVSYKGSLVYKNRRVVKNEPQHNGQIFCVNEVLSSPEFHGFDYRLSHYYDYINTCEVVGAELADWMLANPNRNPPKDFKFRGSPDDAFNFHNRGTYPGINCLTILKGHSLKNKLGKADRFLLHLRDETQLQAQNSVHVLPAGGHQAHTAGTIIEDTAIWRTVVREFLEELYDFEELYKQKDTQEDFFEYREVRPYLERFFLGTDPWAKVFLMGFGLDPVTTKPEVLVTIVVDWANVMSHRPDFQFEFNWEVRSSGKTREQFETLSQENLLRQAKERVQSLNGVYLDALPAGAACLTLASHHLEFLTST